jgi:xanthine dehydrogenase large subunit
VNHVGNTMPHESAAGHVTGSALFTDDLIGRFPNILHAWPVLSPYVHAEVTSVDTVVASQQPGVAAVLTSADVPGENNIGVSRPDEPLFPSEVCHYHQPVAWVLADTLEQARNAASEVRVQYRELDAILTIEQAIERQSFLAGPLRCVRGNAASGIADSALQVSSEIHMGGQEHFYLETQSAIGWCDEAGGVSLHSSTQHPSETQAIVARVLGVNEHRVTVECVRMGGAFGGKEVQANAWAVIAALGASKTNRPVRVRLPRLLDMELTGKRHPFFARYTAGCDSMGRLKGLILQLYSDGGWCLDLSLPVLWRAIFHCDNAYHLPALEATGYVCRTNKTSQTAFRGFGGPQGMLVIEDVMDRIARTLGLPVDLVRERNFYREGDSTHYGMAVRDADRISRIWNELKAASSFNARRDELDRFNSEHGNRKRGLAITPVKFGISFTFTAFNQAGALVLVYRDGSVQVNHGGTEMGQGLHTKIRQIAAECLGVSLETVRVMPTRTDKVPNTSATAASASTDLNGAAVADACSHIVNRLRDVAASLLNCDAAEVEFSGGMVAKKGLAKPILPFRQIVEAAYQQRIALFAQGYYRTPDIEYNTETGQGRPFHYFAFGAAATEVEVDRFTGDTRVLRVDILQDAGSPVSPVIDRGQIEGGFLQGLGWLTIEELLWTKDGKVATNGASTYKLPSWSEMPEDFRVSFLTDANQPGVVFGSKAVGEPPLMLALSVREAIRDAIASFGAEGPVSLDSPATPERVYWAIRRAMSADPQAARATSGALRA